MSILDNIEGLKFTPETIEKYILQKLEENKDFLFNELDLQMFVARSLKKEFSDNYKIHLEYHLPKGWNKKFDEDYSRWGTEIPYIDIILEKEGENSEFIAIELKYKLKKIQDIDLMRFGTKPERGDIVLVTNQSAQNNARYDFWKDVKRIELLTKHFDKVIGGIAMLVTNDESYKTTKEGSNYSAFGLASTPKKGNLEWKDKGKIVGGKGKKTYVDPLTKKISSLYVRPNFELEKEYTGKWYKEGFTGPMDEKFYCYSVII
jgi:hypothetical protein